jgi:hypothetical protein
MAEAEMLRNGISRMVVISCAIGFRVKKQHFGCKSKGGLGAKNKNGWCHSGMFNPVEFDGIKLETVISVA